MRTCVRVRTATILHADLDAFFASVEQRDDPALRGQAGDRRRRRRARGELRGEGVRHPDGDGRAPGAAALPARHRRPAPVVGVLRGEQGRLRGVRGHDAARRGALDRRGLPRRPRHRAARGHARPRSRRGCAAGARRVGLPITVGVARTKFLAKVASAVAKPDGLLVVPPDGELGFLHPLPVERLWGVGPGRPRRSCTPAGFTTVGQVAALDEAPLVAPARPGGGPPPARAGAQPRPPARAGRAPPALDRVAAGARPAAHSPRGDRLVARRARRPGLAAHARGRSASAHGRAAPPLRRLHPRDALAARMPRATVGHTDPRHGARACSRRRCRSSSARAHARRHLRRRTSSDDGAVQLTLHRRPAAARAGRRDRRRPRPVRLARSRARSSRPRSRRLDAAPRGLVLPDADRRDAGCSNAIRHRPTNRYAAIRVLAFTRTSYTVPPDAVPSIPRLLGSASRSNPSFSV